MGVAQVSNTSNPQNILDYLHKLFSYALSVGMSYDQYWHGEPALINDYIEAEELRERRTNSELWLQGAYIYHALCCTVPMFKKPQRYLKQPYALSQAEDEERKYQRFKQQMFDLAKLEYKGGKK